MASGTSWTNNCPECGRHVEIFNGDFEFSMELHKQSHKSLEVINELNHIQGKIENASRCNLKSCNDCKEHIEIINNDVSLSLQLHAQKHKPENLDASSDQSSIPRIRHNQNKLSTKENTQATPVLSSYVEAIFQTMPIGLKGHRGFISEKSCSQAFCNLCEITIEPILAVTEHLKRKLHEDNIIQAIKTLLPSELQDQIDFVSFYGSNLCCNLCESKIDLCADNLDKTVINIFAHNAGKGHLSKKTNRNANSQCEKPLVVLRKLAVMDPSVNENKNFIEHRMIPYYKCKLCDKAISYSENEKELLNIFKGHLNSPGHKKSLDAVSLLNKWNDLNVTGKENHKFVVVKQNIYCVACACFIQTNLDLLFAHVRTNSALHGKNQCETVGLQSANPPNVQTDLPSKEENIQRTGDPINQPGKPVTGEQLPSTSKKSLVKIKIDDVKAQYKELLTTNATIKCNSIYLENENDGYKCKLCNLVIVCGNGLKLLEENIMIHITGKKHKRQLAKEFYGILDKVQITNAVVKENIQFLMRKDEHVWCTACDCKISAIPSADKVDTFTKCLLIHLKGSTHVKKKQVGEEFNDILDKVQITKPVVKENRQFLMRKDEHVWCTPCDYKISTIPSADNVDAFTKCLLIHLKGGKHVKSKIVVEGSNTSPSNPPSNTGGAVEVKKKAAVEGSNSSASVNSSEIVKSYHQNHVKELFDKLPASYLYDIEFISVSAKEGYLTCRLCKSTIHSSYLKEHLDDWQHVLRY